MEADRPSRFEELIPDGGAEPHHAGQIPLEITERDRAHERGEVFAERPHHRAMFIARIDHDDEKDRSARERRDHRLRLIAHQMILSGSLQGEQEAL
jgi:hypothetical protein